MSAYYSTVRERLLGWINFELTDMSDRLAAQREQDHSSEIRFPGGWQDFELIDVVATPRVGVLVFFRSRLTRQMYTYVAFLESDSDHSRIQDFLRDHPSDTEVPGFREFDVYHDDMVFRIGRFEFGSQKQPIVERDVLRLEPLPEA